MGAAALGGLALISLMMGNAIGLVLSAGLAGGVYLGALKKLDEGDIAGARSLALTIAIVIAVVGGAITVMGNMIGVIDMAAAIPVYLATTQMA